MTQTIQRSLYLKTGLAAFLVIGLLLPGCSPASVQNQPADEIVLYNWEGDIPQPILDIFTAESGVKIRYEIYTSQEEAVENMHAGQVYDVVVMDSLFIPTLVNEGLLAELNYQNILNFKNISPNFRDLAYDPGNRYSIPYSWGTCGLLIRTDLARGPITRWGDLWDARYAGKVSLWSGFPRETIALTLKSLGYSANSENPAELEAALAKLIAMKPGYGSVNKFDPSSPASAMASGDIVIAMGDTGQFFESQNMGLTVEYILPEEGALMWADTYVIPANSPNQHTAESFINFLLRPEISAEIVNQKHYASANEAAQPFIDPQILNDPSIYPGNELLLAAEIILPLTTQGQQLYEDIWERFSNAP